MSERRPNWDDDLIDMVLDSLPTRIGGYTLDDVYAVIAAVEDWHASNGSILTGLLAEERDRAERAEDALHAARKATDGNDTILAISRRNPASYYAGYVDALRRVRRALDGDDE